LCAEVNLVEDVNNVDEMKVIMCDKKKHHAWNAQI
jgi:hypothetical protein